MGSLQDLVVTDRPRPSTALEVAWARSRHKLEELEWGTSSGSTRLLRKDLIVLDRYRGLGRQSVLAGLAESRFSQNGEDGIIEALCALMGISQGTFVEIGAADGEQNCTRDLAERGWRGVWVDGDPELVARARELPLGGRVTVVESMVSPSNVVGLLLDAGSDTSPDVMSIDIDGGNYWVTEAAIGRFSPKLLVVEYNGEHQDGWIEPRSAGGEWDGSWNYGASLRSYWGLLGSRGYRLVGCDPAGVNAFFVREDVVADGMFPGSWREHYVPPNHRRGGLGHPRLSAESPRCNRPVDQELLAKVAISDCEVVGRGTRRPGERVGMLLTLRNDSGAFLGPAGDHPVRLSYRLRGSHGQDLEGTGTVPLEPPRSILARVVAPGERVVTGLEVDVPAYPGQVRVVPTLVQEGVAWREPVDEEGVTLCVRDPYDRSPSGSQ